MRKTVKKLLIALAASCTLVICLTGCFNKQDNPKKVELGERYDSDKILLSEDGRTDGIERFAELFDQYSKYTSETKFAVHEETAIAIAEAVMRELYPDDYYGVVRLPRYFRPLYYKAENCWEVWLHKNGLNNLSYREQIQAEVMFVYVDVNTGAVKAIIPADEFSVHNPANSDIKSGENISPENSETNAELAQTGDNAVRNFIYRFISSTTDTNAQEFACLVDDTGFYSITYFSDGRDENIAFHVAKDSIRDDLVLVSSENKVGITLGGLFAPYNLDDIQGMPIHVSPELDKLSFDFDLELNDENTLGEQLDSIISTCEQIIAVNNEYIPQLFALSNNLYAFTESQGTSDIIGNWVLFEKIGDSCYIRAIIEIE